MRNNYIAVTFLGYLDSHMGFLGGLFLHPKLLNQVISA